MAPELVASRTSGQRGPRRTAQRPQSNKSFLDWVNSLESLERVSPNLPRAVVRTVQQSSGNRQSWWVVFCIGYNNRQSGAVEVPARNRVFGRDSRPVLVDELNLDSVWSGEAVDLDEVHVDTTIAPLTESFIDRAIRLEARGKTSAALDLIYDQVDERLIQGAFSEVDNVLAKAETSRLSSNLLVGLLTITLPARGKLVHRAEFLDRVQRELNRRGELEDGLLIGLD